jgi:hypothetical protein
MVLGRELMPAWNGVERFLLRSLGGNSAWSTDLASAAVLEDGAYHGVLPLLFQSVHATPAWIGWPEALRAAVRDTAQRRAVTELAQRQDVARILDAFAARGIDALILKGAALAHTLYAEPWLRPRGDTDLLIRIRHRQAALEVLQEHGYRRADSAGGELASSEATFSKAGSALPLDLHWRISNSSLLASMADFDALRARALPVPAFGPHAWSPGMVDAVLLAATHRATHHQMPFYSGERARRGDRLIWLYDLHLLVPRLGPAQLDELAQRAARSRVAGLCLDALEATHAAFDTALPAMLMAELARAASQPEPSMLFLHGGRRRLLLAELRALPGWRERGRLLREHALPPGDYMLRKYGTQRRWLLPALYVRRAFGWLTR